VRTQFEVTDSDISSDVARAAYPPGYPFRFLCNWPG
jgi:hypothetical protein